MSNNCDYQNFFNTLELLLFVLDIDGNILYCNDTACDRLGYSRDELIGMPVIDIHPPEQRMFASMLVKDMLDGNADVCPIPIQRRDGKLIQAETRVYMGIWQGKKVLFGVTKDVTDLSLSNEKFTTIFRFNPIAVAITTIKDGTFLEVNDAWSKLTGYSSEEAIGKTVFDLQLYRTNEEREALLTELKVTGFLNNYPIIMRVKGNRNIVGQFSAAHILIDDVECWITALVDITDQVKLEEAISAFRDTVIREARDGIVRSLREGTFVK